MSAKEVFKQIHVGKFRGGSLWHSEDGGQTWWSGWMFSHSAKVTRKELEEMAVSVLRDLPEEE